MFIGPEINTVTQAINTAMQVSAAFMVVIGVLECYFGYKLFKIRLRIAAFLFGSAVGWLIPMAFLSPTATSPDSLIAITVLTSLIGLVLGILLAVHIMKIYRFAVFLSVAVSWAIVGVVCLLLADFLPRGVGDFLNDIAIISFVLAIPLGIVAAIFVKPVIIVSTALTGASLIATNIVAVFGESNPGITTLAFLICLITGIMFQWNTNKDKIEPTVTYHGGPVPQQPVYTANYGSTSAEAPAPAPVPAPTVYQGEVISLQPIPTVESNPPMIESPIAVKQDEPPSEQPVIKDDIRSTKAEDPAAAFLKKAMSERLAASAVTGSSDMGKGSSRACVNCNFVLGDGATFCGNCGKAVEKELGKTCENCGFAIPGNDSFCRNCGWAVS